MLSQDFSKLLENVSYMKVFNKNLRPTFNELLEYRKFRQKEKLRAILKHVQKNIEKLFF